MTDLLHILISLDNVSICGTIVKRPDHVSPSEWQEFWKSALENQDDDNSYETGYEDGYEAGRDSLEDEGDQA